MSEPVGARPEGTAVTVRPPLWHYAILAVLPGLISILNRNWPYLNLGTTDAWYYFGSFIHFPRIQRVLPSYPGERVLWVLPGYALVHLLGVVRGIYVLHVVVFLACVYLLHFVLLKTTDYRTAFLGALLLGCNPFFIGPNGWDYPEGLSMACLLASVSLAIIRPATKARGNATAFFGGAAWAGLLNTYLPWLIFAPAYAYVMLQTLRKAGFGWRRMARSAAWCLAGGASAAITMWGAYSTMGGPGFFFAENLRTAVALSSVGNAPWLPPDWYRQPTWLYFPALAVCLSAIGIVGTLRIRTGGALLRRDLLGFYLLCAAAITYMSLRPARFLMFDYKTSILVPGVFIVLGLVLFRVPERTPNPLFYAICALASAVCLAPLARRGLYEVAFHSRFLLAMLVLMILVAAFRVRLGSHPLWWAVGVCLFSSASFGLIPSSTGQAWWSDYRGADLYERAARASDAILRRTPEAQYPVFWYADLLDSVSAEFRGVMCSMITINQSMKLFPAVDKTYAPGARIFVLQQQPGVAPAAIYLLARAGMPSVVRSRDKISFGDVSYWITQLEVRPLSLSAIREGFEPAGGMLQGPAKVPATVRRDKPRCCTLRLPVSVRETGIYHFELSLPKGSPAVRFGAIGGDGRDWLEEATKPITDGTRDVAWFRAGLKAGEPFFLAAESGCGQTDCMELSAANIQVWRDRSAGAIGAFNYLRGKKALDGNLMPNGAFEGGTAGWDGMKGNIRAASDSDCYSGGCVEFTPRGKEMQYLVSWDAVQLKQGSWYELSAWLRSGAGKPLRIECGLWENKRQKWVGVGRVTITPQWSEVKVRFQSDSNQKLSPIFWESLGEYGSMFVDEVELKAVDADRAGPDAPR